MTLVNFNRFWNSYSIADSQCSYLWLVECFDEPEGGWDVETIKYHLDDAFERAREEIQNWTDEYSSDYKPKMTEQDVEEYLKELADEYEPALQECIRHLVGGSQFEIEDLDGIEAIYGGGEYRAQVDEDEDGGYTISYFSTREMMPAFKTQSFTSREALIAEMRSLNPEATAWKPVEYDI